MLMKIMRAPLVRFKFLEFIAGVLILTALFLSTNQTYWYSGSNSPTYIFEGSVIFGIVYEIFLLYLPLSALLWILTGFSGNKLLQVASSPILFLMHSSLIAHILFWRPSAPLVLAIVAIMAFDTVTAWWCLRQ